MKRITRAALIVSAIMLAFSIVVPQAATAAGPQPASASSSNAALTAPRLLSPANRASVPANPTLRWSAVPGAARYHIQIAHQTYFDQQYNFIEYWGLTSTSYRIAGHPEAYTPRLYWRVQAIDANGVQGPWSEVRQFTITTRWP